MENLTITELESYLNVTQFLIDKVLKEGKMNNPNYNLEVNMKLRTLSNYQSKIIKEIERRLNDNIF